MLEYFLKRLITIVPTLVLVSMLIFGLQQLLPGDPAVILAGEERDPAVVRPGSTCRRSATVSARARCTTRQPLRLCNAF